MKYKIGDKVAVLDDDMKGVVVEIVSAEIHVKTQDEFILIFRKEDLIPIGEEQSEIAKKVIVSEHLAFKTDYKKGKNKTKTKRNKEIAPPMEVDLHIHKLVKSVKGLDNYDMLSLQLDTAKHKIEFAIRNRIPRIVFIHGVGEGVLKSELNYLLNRYPVTISEASYQKYGMGATEVYILQNK